MATAFEDLRMLQAVEAIADELWKEIMTWGNFPRDVVGKQMARSADSIGANIAESYGRYHYGEKLQFLYYARGSLFETKYWINRCQKRGLLDHQKVNNYSRKLSDAARQINLFANSLKQQKRTKSKPNSIKEPSPTYNAKTETHSLFSHSDIDWLESPISQSPNL